MIPNNQEAIAQAPNFQSLQLFNGKRQMSEEDLIFFESKQPRIAYKTGKLQNSDYVLSRSSATESHIASGGLNLQLNSSDSNT